MSLLEVENLHTHFVKRDLRNQVRVARALNGVSFRVDRGEIVGLVGESGAGKSLTASSIMGLLGKSARIVQGSIRFQDQELVGMTAEQLDAVRGSEITMIVQSPITSLDPLSRVGDQLIRVQREHHAVAREEARRRAIEMLMTVKIPDPERRMRAWPHELSGGMAQRILIAMALINAPKLLIADEPTTGLDVTVQAQVLDLLNDLVRSRDMAAIIITHDLGIVANYCTRVAVMFSGAIVETGPTREVFARPRHPYTQALLDSVPERAERRGGGQLSGAPPNLYALPTGCLYNYRCSKATETCRGVPPLIDVGPDHRALCHHASA